MVLPPQIYAHFEAQWRVLTTARSMAQGVVRDFRGQLVYLDLSEGDIYETAYTEMRDGCHFLTESDGLTRDLFCMYAEFAPCPGYRAHRRNGSGR